VSSSQKVVNLFKEINFKVIPGVTPLLIIDWLIFFIFLSLLSIIGIFKLKNIKSEEQYLLAGRKTGFIALTATLVMTEFNTGTLLAFSGMGYVAQGWALALPFIFLIGLLFYAGTVAKKWKEFNGLSVAHYFTERYGKNIGLITAVILFLAMVGFSSTYIKSLSLLFLPLFPGLNAWALSGILTSVVLIMTLKGGLISIIRTDVVSFLAVLIFLPILLYFSWNLDSTGMDATLSIHQSLAILPPQFILSLIILTMFSYILAPWYAQKIVSAQSPKIAYFSVVVAAIFVFLLYGLGIGAANFLSIKGVQLQGSEQALPYLIHYALPWGLRGLGYGILFAIASTTLAGVWSAMVTILVGGIKSSGSQESVKRGFYLTLFCANLSYLGANAFVDHILDKMILANIPVVALSFALLGGFYWNKASRLGVYVSILTGIACGVGFYYFYGESGMYTWYWALIGVPAIFFSGIVGSYFERMRVALWFGKKIMVIKNKIYLLTIFN